MTAQTEPLSVAKSNAMGTFGGAMIVAGTSIGAGMLALPVVTSPAGFFPSLVTLILCWIVMTITGLLFAELCLLFKQEVNILSMAKKTVGRAGEMATWLLYLFLFYCLSIAYLVGAANFLTDLGGSALSDTVRIGLVALLLIVLVAKGKKIVDPVNRLLMCGLFAAYAGFVLIGSPSIRPELLQFSDWTKGAAALPVVFTSFGFQGTIPTLSSWMHYDRKKIYKAVCIGTTLTLFMYVLWQALFLGIVPQEGPHGLMATLQAGHDAVHPLIYFTNSPVVWALGRVFAFCALATSFLGVGIGLVDFLADGLGIEKKRVSQKALLLLLAFGVPVVLSLIYPHIFLQALGLAGGFGCALLLGVLPVLMIWKANFKPAQRSLIYNKGVWILLLTFVAFEIYIECHTLINSLG